MADRYGERIFGRLDGKMELEAQQRMGRTMRRCEQRRSKRAIEDRLAARYVVHGQT